MVNLVARLTADERANLDALLASQAAGEDDPDLRCTSSTWPSGRRTRTSTATSCRSTRSGSNRPLAGVPDTMASVRAHFAAGTLERGLPRLDLRALFIHGEGDPMPMRSSTESAALIKGATGRGHQGGRPLPLDGTAGRCPRPRRGLPAQKSQITSFDAGRRSTGVGAYSSSHILSVSLTHTNISSFHLDLSQIASTADATAIVAGMPRDPNIPDAFDVYTLVLLRRPDDAPRAAGGRARRAAVTAPGLPGEAAARRRAGRQRPARGAVGLARFEACPSSRATSTRRGA